MSYFENANPKSEEHYKRGKKIGVWKYYYENKQLQSIGFFKNDFQDSTYTEWFSNGNINKTGNFKNDKEVGTWKYYYENGQLKEEASFDDKGKKLITFIDKAGKQIITNGNGFLINYFDNGAKRAEGNYENGYEKGEWKFYTPNGELDFSEIFVDGTKNGKAVYYINSKKSRE